MANKAGPSEVTVNDLGEDVIQMTEAIWESDAELAQFRKECANIYFPDWILKRKPQPPWNEVAANINDNLTDVEMIEITLVPLTQELVQDDDVMMTSVVTAHSTELYQPINGNETFLVAPNISKIH